MYAYTYDGPCPINCLYKATYSKPSILFLILPQSITAHDDKYIWCKALSQPQSNAGSIDITRSAPHTLLIQRDGLDIHLMAVFLLPLDFIVSRIPFRVWTYCSCSPTTRSSIHRLDIIIIEKLLKISLHSNDGEILHVDNSFIYCKISNYYLRQSMSGLLSSFKLRRETCQLLCVRQQRQKKKRNFFTFWPESLSRFRYSAGGVWFFSLNYTK